MIEKISISNYKCIDYAELELKPLTIVTGLNSTGKSTLLQAILLPEAFMMRNGILGISRDFNVTRCKYVDRNEIMVEIKYSAKSKCLKSYATKISIEGDDEVKILYGKRMFYLAANRIIGDSVGIKIPEEIAISPNGLDAFATYEMEKNTPVIDKLLKDEDSGRMLSAQVNYWLKEILDLNIKLSTSLTDTKQRVDISYTSDDIDNITPSNLGTGVTFLAEMLITCLRAKEGDIMLIENPEIHLHPKAQSKVGEFLAFVANAGIQVIVETHCENMINRIQYEVYSHQLTNTDVIIYYKEKSTTPYIPIALNKKGQYCINHEENVEFPEGFFDATLKELIEMA